MPDQSKSNTPTLPYLKPYYVNDGNYIYLYPGHTKRTNNGKVRFVKGPKSAARLELVEGTPLRYLVVWKDWFLSEHPELRAFNTYYQPESVDGYAAVPQSCFSFAAKSGTSSSNSMNVQQYYEAGATWTLDRLLNYSPLLCALNSRSFKHCTSEALLSWAYYVALTDSTSFADYTKFVGRTRLPTQEPFSEEYILSSMAELTNDNLFDFWSNLKKRIADLNESSGDYWIIDTAFPHNVLESLRQRQHVPYLEQFKDLKTITNRIRRNQLFTSNLERFSYQRVVSTQPQRIMTVLSLNQGQAYAFTAYNEYELSSADLAIFLQNCSMWKNQPYIKEEGLSSEDSPKELLNREDHSLLSDAQLAPRFQAVSSNMYSDLRIHDTRGFFPSNLGLQKTTVVINNNLLSRTSSDKDIQRPTSSIVPRLDITYNPAELSEETVSNNLSLQNEENSISTRNSGSPMQGSTKLNYRARSAYQARHNAGLVSADSDAIEKESSASEKNNSALEKNQSASFKTSSLSTASLKSKSEVAAAANCHSVKEGLSSKNVASTGSSKDVTSAGLGKDVASAKSSKNVENAGLNKAAESDTPSKAVKSATSGKTVDSDAVHDKVSSQDKAHDLQRKAKVRSARGKAKASGSSSKDKKQATKTEQVDKRSQSEQTIVVSDKQAEDSKPTVQENSTLDILRNRLHISGTDELPFTPVQERKVYTPYNLNETIINGGLSLSDHKEFHSQHQSENRMAVEDSSCYSSTPDTSLDFSNKAQSRMSHGVMVTDRVEHIVEQYDFYQRNNQPFMLQILQDSELYALCLDTVLEDIISPNSYKAVLNRSTVSIDLYAAPERYAVILNWLRGNGNLDESSELNEESSNTAKLRSGVKTGVLGSLFDSETYRHNSPNQNKSRWSEHNDSDWSKFSLEDEKATSKGVGAGKTKIQSLFHGKERVTSFHLTLHLNVDFRELFKLVQSLKFLESFEDVDNVVDQSEYNQALNNRFNDLKIKQDIVERAAGRIGKKPRYKLSQEQIELSETIDALLQKRNSILVPQVAAKIAQLRASSVFDNFGSDWDQQSPQEIKWTVSDEKRLHSALKKLLQTALPRTVVQIALTNSMPNAEDALLACTMLETQTRLYERLNMEVLEQECKPQNRVVSMLHSDQSKMEFDGKLFLWFLALNLRFMGIMKMEKSNRQHNFGLVLSQDVLSADEMFDKLRNTICIRKQEGLVYPARVNADYMRALYNFLELEMPEQEQFSSCKVINQVSLMRN